MCKESYKIAFHRLVVCNVLCTEADVHIVFKSIVSKFSGKQAQEETLVYREFLRVSTTPNIS